MAGTTQGGNKVKNKLLEQNPKYYEELGRNGGKAKHRKPQGFASFDKVYLREVAARGGKASRRGKTNAGA